MYVRVKDVDNVTLAEHADAILRLHEASKQPQALITVLVSDLRICFSDRVHANTVDVAERELRRFWLALDQMEKARKALTLLGIDWERELALLRAENESPS